MSKVELVRSSYAASFSEVLNNYGAPTERLLNEIGLSEQILHVPGGYMTVPKLWQVSALAASYSGIPDIGLHAGMVPLINHGQFGETISSSPTLFRALAAFCDGARTEMTHANFHIVRAAENVWLCGGSVEGDEAEVSQVELYRIGLFTQIVRMAVGLNWKPLRVQLQSRGGRHLHGTKLLQDANIDFGCQQPALAIPQRWLSLRISKPSIPTQSHIADQHSFFSTFSSTPGYFAMVKEIVRTHVLAGEPSISAIAKSLDQPVRSLQRHLGRRRTNISDLLDEVRIEVALAYLSNDDISISEIAMSVGYSQPSHFIRAFRRLMGVTPGQYRRSQAASRTC